ncbi:MAG: hypothetical protein LBR65_02080 [Culturomica sp.]|jgi:hypothetical protein|nr:hypothetical protein [Culturomica sp.]
MVRTKETKAVLSASVLATVLVAGTLLLLAVLGVFLLWDLHTGQAAAYHRKKQLQLHVESGFVLYAADSVAGSRMVQDSVYRLYEEEGNACLRAERYLWGLYEVVTVATVEGNASSVRMFGKAHPGPQHPALWVCNRRKAISFAGTTALFGEAWLPENGLQYVQMHARFFEGKPVEKEQIKTSGEQLPATDPAVRKNTEALWQLPEDTLSGGNLSVRRSFREAALCVGIAGERLEGDARGRVILRGEHLVIGSESRLQDILIVAASVRIESGFTGKVQVFARDSVVLEEKVLLEYPSGIYLQGEAPEGYLKMGEACEVNGYVIVEGTAPLKGRPKARYIQPENTRIRGLLWVNGIAQVQGSITGSVWLCESYYFAPEGFYSNIFYNARFFATDHFPYPLWQESAYERRCVQWLY